jgi:hypothetical protein
MGIDLNTEKLNFFCQSYYLSERHIITTMTYFHLNRDNEAAIRRILANLNAKDTEIELRFGGYHYDRVNKTKSFNSSVDVETFYQLKKTFMQHKFNSKTTKTVEYSYPGSVKRIVNESGAETCMIKNNCTKYDIFDYDFRISVAKESQTETRPSGAHSLIRRKSRVSFQLPIGSLDLTIVDEEMGEESKRKYEVELEVFGQGVTYESILSYVTIILQTRQKNYFVISGGEKRFVLNEYRDTLQVPYFVGAQPETLQRGDLSLFYKERFSVTDKADGERMLMFIANNGNVYFIDSNMNKVYRTDVKSSKFTACIVDGELVPVGKQICFLAFDVMMFNKQDIRGNTEYLLEQRLCIVRDIVASLGTSQLFQITTKMFQFGNVYLGAQTILDKVDKGGSVYGNDGLIFTPIDEPYPKTKKWRKLLKWKPANLNTIDFYSVKDSSGTWKLYVQHFNREAKREPGKPQNSRPEKVLFDVEKLCPTPVHVDKVTFQTTFDDNLIDPTTGEAFVSNTVIEYKWDKAADKFVPIRTRWDKTQNPNKHGNFSAVACDIWNNIHNPVDREMFSKLTVGKEDVHFERMKRFHNKIKESLYNQYANGCTNLLELCSGRGGDLHKWIYNNIQNIVGYDISDRNIAECERRVVQMKHKISDTNMKFAFHQLDLCSPKAVDVMRGHNNGTKFNNISCHFGMHYFFQSQESFENLINTLKTFLAADGFFVATFMDSLEIEKLYKTKGSTNGTIVEKQNDQVVYYISQDSKSDEMFGNKLKIRLDGNNILAGGSDEYIVDFNAFVQVMNTNGFELVDTKLFSDVDNKDSSLTSVETDISFLNRYTVFKRIENGNLESELALPKTTTVVQPSVFTTIDLHHMNLTAHKISTRYDIVDLVNCIEYKFYKNTFQNGDIASFDDILDTFKACGIVEYIPLHVNVLHPSEITSGCESFGDTTNYIHFIYNRHTIERKVMDTESDTIEYNNWYILLLEGKILYTRSDMQRQVANDTSANGASDTSANDTSANDTSASDTNDANDTSANDANDTSDTNDASVSTELPDINSTATNMKEVTVVMLRERLKALGLKTAGKKQDLYDRLVEYNERMNEMKTMK